MGRQAGRQADGRAGRQAGQAHMGQGLTAFRPSRCCRLGSRQSFSKVYVFLSQKVRPSQEKSSRHALQSKEGRRGLDCSAGELPSTSRSSCSTQSRSCTTSCFEQLDHHDAKTVSTLGRATAVPCTPAHSLACSRRRSCWRLCSPCMAGGLHCCPSTSAHRSCLQGM